MGMVWFIVLLGFNFISFISNSLLTYPKTKDIKFKLGIRLKHDRFMVHSSLCLAFSLPSDNPHNIITCKASLL